MKNEDFRIVIDTNLWISMALGSKIVSKQMLAVLGNKNTKIFTSTDQLNELTQTLSKPKLQKYLFHNRTKYLFQLIWLKTDLIEVKTKSKICRDSNDDFIVDLAFDSNATHLITGDLDLLVLNPIRKIEVLTISDFLKN